MPNDQFEPSPVSRCDSHASGAGKKDADVASRLQALKDIDNMALREEWRRLYRVAPPNTDPP